jgi:hypothetical protein
VSVFALAMISMSVVARNTVPPSDPFAPQPSPYSSLNEFTRMDEVTL